MAKKKRIAFEMHANLLKHVFRSQAGTLSKAIAEGAMNAVDAEADALQISVSDTRVVLMDNGRGFRNEDEIREWFAKVGTPHQVEEKKVYASFRMGRGQMFNFGRNRWRTGKFVMTVDIEDDAEDAVGFDFTTVKKPFKGCAINIDLYQRLLPSELDATIREVKRYVKYMPIPVTLNGEEVSVDPELEHWDHITDDAYIRLHRTGELEVYNLGVYVRGFGGWAWGTGGEVVSKQKLKLNFPRNDIMSDCPVWQRVRKIVDSRATKHIKKSTTLNENERKRLIDQIRLGTKSWTGDTLKLKLFTAANGRHYSLDQIYHMVWKVPAVTQAPAGNRKADRIQQSLSAFVFSEDSLRAWDVDPKQDPKAAETLLAQICDALPPDSWMTKQLGSWPFVPFDQIAGAIKDSFVQIAKNKYTANETVWMNLVDKCRQVWDPLAKARRILVGRSDSADGWTDGSTFICCGQAFLKQQKFDLRGVGELGHLLLHEYCHDGPDTESHVHGQEFFEKYHDNRRCQIEFVRSAVSNLPAVIRAVKRRVDKGTLKLQDLTVATEMAAESLEPAARTKRSAKKKKARKA